MKYTQNYIEEDINISKTSPLKELFILLSGALAIIIVLYFLAGLFVDKIVLLLPNNIQRNIETSITNVFLSSKEFKSSPEYADVQTKLQTKLDFLVDKTPELIHKNYVIRVVKDKEVNAFALPGGYIAVTSSLLKEVGTGRELDFVLSHELDHFAHRDHLTAFGRRIILLALSTMLLGENKDSAKFVLGSVENTEMRFSQNQEKAADLWAVDLMYNKYHSTLGVTSFMEKISKKEKLPDFIYFFATHPSPNDRILAINNYIKEKGYK